MTVYAEQLSCQELVELVTDYLEGALSEEETVRFESHIGNTPVYNVSLTVMGRDFWVFEIAGAPQPAGRLH